MCSNHEMSDNNGNLLKQEVYIPGSNSFAQFYAYDSLNRLHSMTEGSWHQDYDYDRWGNRTINQSTTTGIPKPFFGVNPITNRLTVPSGYSGTMTYDNAGNLTVDTYGAAAVMRLYDAENRMTKETQANSYEAGVYSYDGDGHRVKRKVGSVETWQVYGLGGELVAEYGANTAASSPQKEYGYRNGQLLVTITSGSGWGSMPSLDDNPLNPPNQPKTDVKAIHITQFRTAINALRSHYNLPAYQWQKPTASGGAINSAVLISWEPIDEMRTAIDQAIGPPPLGYSAGLAYGQPIKAVHIQELRDRLLQVWSADIRWLVTDQLGTPRMIFDQSGSLATVSRHDYLPFGEELFAGTAGRTTTQGYSLSDNVRQKFTLKERDNETGLDYFGARYYGSTQGRFVSPDPLHFWMLDRKKQDQYISNPQRWNRYTYVLNNPLSRVDPDG